MRENKIMIELRFRVQHLTYDRNFTTEIAYGGRISNSPAGTSLWIWNFVKVKLTVVLGWVDVIACYAVSVQV